MRSEVTIKHPIHSQLVLRDDGDGDVARTVFCRQSGQSVPLGRCEGCARRVQRVPDPSRADASVTCKIERHATPKTADTRERASRVLVGELMSRRVVCVEPEVELGSLERLMEDGEALVVVDAARRPLGMISRLDALRAVRDGGAGDAEDTMTPLVHAIVEDAPLAFAIALLAFEDVSQIPVVTGEGEVVGLLRSRDVVRWLAGGLGYEVLEPGA